MLVISIVSGDFEDSRALQPNGGDRSIRGASSISEEIHKFVVGGGGCSFLPCQINDRPALMHNQAILPNHDTSYFHHLSPTQMSNSTPSAIRAG